ncbi:MAG: ribosomal protein L7/L12 [Bacteroidales bacterium]|nr:ribosomal protein L7/L12 [Bacteroidales bacterium]
MKKTLLTIAMMLAVLAATFTVVLKEVGPHKVKVIKVLRTVLGVELKDAFSMLEEMPSVLLENATQEQAESLRTELEELGATVEIVQNQDE